MNNLTNTDLDHLLHNPKEAVFREAVDTAGNTMRWLLASIGKGLADIKPNVALRSSALPKGYTYAKNRNDDPRFS